MATGFVNKIGKAIKNAKKQKAIKKWRTAGSPTPPPHEIKQTVIEKYQSISGYKILVETGTFRGEMVEAQRENFERIYSIELSEKLWRAAADRFKAYDKISIVHGDSGKVLNGIVAKLDQPAIFWLDGHYSAGETAKGDTECPIFEELAAILQGKDQHHILLVDDARLFNGKGDYPSIEALTNFVVSRNKLYSCEVKDDVIRYTIQ